MELILATLLLIALTCIPALELRFSIPVGILTARVALPFIGEVGGLGLNPLYVFTVCVVTNALLGAILYALLRTVIERMLIPHWPWFARMHHRQLGRAQRKIHPRHLRALCFR